MSDLEACMIPPAHQVDLIQEVKTKKQKWGPTLLHDRPRRHVEDGRTTLQKAMELKAIQNLEAGHQKNPGISFNVLDSSYLHDISSKVNVTLGNNRQTAFQNIDVLKTVEKDKCSAFIDANPETVLPSNLDLSQSEVHSNAKCMPSVHDTEQNSPKETWSRIVQKGLKPSLQKNVSNERCILEH